MNDIIRALSLKNITKNYNDGFDRKTEVLKDLNIEINRSESVAISGPSGSGKTTLLNILGLLDTPSSGKIYFFGQDAETINEKDMNIIRNKKIGFVFQNHNLLSQLTVKENILLPVLASSKIISNEDEERADYFINYLKINKVSDKKTSMISGGEKIRTALARSLINKPDLILADEPTGSLDNDNAIRVLELLRVLQSKELFTLVTVTHSTSVSTMMDKQFILKNGKV